MSSQLPALKIQQRNVQCSCCFLEERVQHTSPCRTLSWMILLSDRDVLSWYVVMTDPVTCGCCPDQLPPGVLKTATSPTRNSRCFWTGAVRGARHAKRGRGMASGKVTLEVHQTFRTRDVLRQNFVSQLHLPAISSLDFTSAGHTKHSSAVFKSPGFRPSWLMGMLQLHPLARCQVPRDTTTRHAPRRAFPWCCRWLSLHHSRKMTRARRRALAAQRSCHWTQAKSKTLVMEAVGLPVLSVFQFCQLFHLFPRWVWAVPQMV